MKALRILLVSCISFCLLNVQMVVTTQGLKVHTNTAFADACPGLPGIQEGHECGNQTNSQNFQTTESYNQQEASTGGHGWMEQITLLAIGFIVAGWFMKCYQPLPADMIVAAVGAGALIIGEIVAISMYQGTAAKMEMTYQADHEGKALNNDDQVQAFRTELENNQEIESALETKLMIQIAAEVAFAAALALAITFTVIFYVTGAVCVAGSALAVCPGPCQVQCTATAAVAGQLMARDAVPEPSTAEATEKKVEAQTTQACPACTGLAQFSNQYFAGCFSVAQNNGIPGFGEEMIAKLKKDRPEMSRIAEAVAKDYNATHFNQNSSIDESSKKELMYETMVENGFKHLKTDKLAFSQDVFPVKLHSENEDEFNYYLQSYENNQFKNGKIKSISLDEYERFNDLFGYQNIDGELHYGMRDLLAMAAEKGLDLLLPKAEANFGKILTLVGGVLLGVVVAMNFGMDFMIGTGLKRSIVYTGFVIAVGLGIKATNDDLSATRENIEKLEKIITNLSDLNSGPMVTHTQNSGGGGTGGKINRPKINHDGQDIPLGLENDNATPCLGGSSNGNCNSVQEQYKTASAIDGFTLGSGLNTTASQVASLGDDISGTKSLSSSTLGKINNLGKNKGALDKINRDLKAKLKDQLKKNKMKDINLNKAGNNFLGDMQKAMLKKMKEQGTTPGALMASMGMPDFSKNKKTDKDKALEDAKKALAANKKGMGTVKAKTPKMRFDFGDNKGGVAGVGTLDDPNKIGSDEEYVIDDIVENKGASLWQIISVRYLKSGYKRLSGEKISE